MIRNFPVRTNFSSPLICSFSDFLPLLLDGSFLTPGVSVFFSATNLSLFPWVVPEVEGKHSGSSTSLSALGDAKWRGGGTVKSSEVSYQSMSFCVSKEHIVVVVILSGSRWQDYASYIFDGNRLVINAFDESVQHSINGKHLRNVMECCEPSFLVIEAEFVCRRSLVVINFKV